LVFQKYKGCKEEKFGSAGRNSLFYTHEGTQGRNPKTNPAEWAGTAHF